MLWTFVMIHGESAIASKIEMGGKILMIYMSLPIILGVIEVITNILT